jgi:hypothetical protein
MLELRLRGSAGGTRPARQPRGSRGRGPPRRMGQRRDALHQSAELNRYVKTEYRKRLGIGVVPPRRSAGRNPSDGRAPEPQNDDHENKLYRCAGLCRWSLFIGSGPGTFDASAKVEREWPTEFGFAEGTTANERGDSISRTFPMRAFTSGRSTANVPFSGKRSGACERLALRPRRKPAGVRRCRPARDVHRPERAR